MTTDDHLNELLIDWQERLEQGEDLSARELCQDCPELAEELEERIDEIRQMNALLPDAPPAGRPKLADGTSVGAEHLPVGIPGYEILGILGRGGMSVVYKARQKSLNRLVALKMIRGWEGARPESVARFLREAETIAKLRHPNIVQIHDFGRHSENPYFAMELLERGSLAEKFAGNPQPPGQAAALVETLARATQVAHENGVVHRDLKPGNVLLSADGLLRITDFGLAHSRDSQMTATGEVLGTPSYMAPEQAAGQNDVGPSADIYAMGGILYELLTGRPPFRGASVFDTIGLVMTTEPVRPCHLIPKVPRDLETICLKCLHKEPHRRYGSAAELAEDLRRFQANEPIVARPTGQLERVWRWSRRHPASAALLMVSLLTVILLIGTGFWVSARVGVERGEREAANIRAAAADQLAAEQRYFGLLNQAREHIARARPGWTWAGLDALAAAHATRTPEESQLAELRSMAALCLGSVDVRPSGIIGQGLIVQSVAWHPKRQQVALGERLPLLSLAGQVSLISLKQPDEPVKLSFPPQVIFRDGLNVAPDYVSALAFSPDGRWLVAGTRSGRLHRWDLDTKTTTAESWPGHADAIDELAFSADGKGLYSRDRVSVKRWTLDSWKESAVHKASEVFSLAIHPAEGWLLCVGSQVDYLHAETLQPVRPAAGRRFGTWRWLPSGGVGVWTLVGGLHLSDERTGHHYYSFRTPGNEQAEGANITDLAVSPYGTLVLSSCRAHNHVKLWEVISGKLIADLATGGGECRVAFSPDGQSFCVTGEKETRLYAIAARPEQTVAANHGMTVNSIAIHPDGGSLACLYSGANWMLTVEPLEKSLPLEQASKVRFRQALIGNNNEEDPPLAFSSDGRLLACGLLHEKRFSVWNPENGQEKRLALAGERCRTLAFSRDGRLWGDSGDALRIWDPASGKQIRVWRNTFATHLSGKPNLHAVNVGERWAATVGQDGGIRIWPTDTKSLEEQTYRQLTAEPLVCAAFSEGTSLVAAGSNAGRLVVARLPDGKVLAETQASDDQINSVVIKSKDWFISGSRDGSVRLWRFTSGKLVDMFSLRHARPVRQIALGADGLTLAVLLQGERGVRVWRLDRVKTQFDQLAFGTGLNSLSPSVQTAKFK